MSNLQAVELKVHLPARDFDLSKQFYQDLGFTLCWSSQDMAELHWGDHGRPAKASFLLQRFDVPGFAENLQMHLLVKDVDAWWAELQRRQIVEKYGVRAEPPEDRPWGLRDFVLVDPSGVLWRIAQD